MEMRIRKAEDKDALRIKELLSQVLELHADVRPDIFISGTTKYTEKEIKDILKDEKRLTYVAVDGDGTVLGYALCEIKEPTPSNNIRPFSALYIDDLCVDETARGRNVGKQLFLYVKEEAKRLGCYEITLNVWEGNYGAKRFYDKMGMKPKSTTMELILE